MSDYTPPFGEKPIPENEAELIETILKANRTMMKSDGDGLDRAQHPKGHGLVDATFSIANDIPEKYQVGIFGTKGTYKAKIRFSNGGSYDDAKPDAHGMAIKLAGVSGPKLLDDMAVDESADFILIDNETFFEGDLEDYAEFNDFLAAVIGFARNRTNVLEGAAKFIFIRTKQMLQRRLGLGEPSAAAEFSDQPPISPLKSCYWSATPYQLGDETAVKYEACPDPRPSAPKELSGKDGISEALAAELEAGPARFHFNALVQPNWETHPADDPTISWRGTGEDPVRLGTIEIPKIGKGELAKSRADSEAIRFNPWNTLPAHRPLGAINRARRIVYQELASVRLG